MADQDIAGLSKAQTGYVDTDDEFVMQKNGASVLTRADVSDIFGGWRDLQAPIVGAGIPPSSAPSLATFSSAGLYQYAFAVNDYAILTFHIDHDMKQNATMYPHVHWTTNGTSTASVKWELKYSVAAGHNQAAFPTETTITFEEAASGTAFQHMITEDATGVATPEVDSLVVCTIKRITNGALENNNTVYGLTVDWHYPTQMYATKNRAPNFYT